jgi:hypothetical protein
MKWRAPGQPFATNFNKKSVKLPEQIPASILKITNLVDAKQQLREIFAQTLEDLSKLKPQTKAE